MIGVTSIQTSSQPELAMRLMHSVRISNVWFRTVVDIFLHIVSATVWTIGRRYWYFYLKWLLDSAQPAPAEAELTSTQLLESDGSTCGEDCFRRRLVAPVSLNLVDLRRIFRRNTPLGWRYFVGQRIGGYTPSGSECEPWYSALPCCLCL